MSCCQVTNTHYDGPILRVRLTEMSFNFEQLIIIRPHMCRMPLLQTKNIDSIDLAKRLAIGLNWPDTMHSITTIVSPKPFNAK